ncbi:MAG: SURF1 family protein [Janthinobacterium lividum]
MLALTLSLGVWQIERLHWKEALLSDIDRAEAAPAIPMPANPTPFEKIEISGTLRGDLMAHYGSEVRGVVGGAKIGAQLIVPLDRPGQPPVLVDLGWLPDDSTLRLPVGPTTITGYIRPAEPAGRLSPGPDLTERRFWSLDPAPIGRSLGLTDVAPYTVVALGPIAAIPSPAQSLPRPSNDHLGYAATWFGLALCLVGIFVVFARRTLRQ